MSELVNYDRRLYAVYAKARALPPQALSSWMAAFARHAGTRRPLTVLDLGSGTGRFSPALADEFGGPVYGVEPSERMRAVARESARHERVTYLPGAADRIPLPDGSCDLVLMFLVLHHVGDRESAAAEVARVLRPGGRLLIRNTFSDRMPSLRWHEFFPRARQIEAELFPSVTDVVRGFTAAGLREVALEQVRQRIVSNLAEYAERLRLRAICTFEYLTEEEIEAGLAALDAAAAAEQADGLAAQPIEEDCDLLVMARDAET